MNPANSLVYVLLQLGGHATLAQLKAAKPRFRELEQTANKLVDKGMAYWRERTDGPPTLWLTSEMMARPCMPKLRLRRTPRQLEVLCLFLLHARRKGGRNTFPTVAEVGRQMNPPITRETATKHVHSLWARGDLRPRGREDYQWRQWELTPQGRKRAAERWKVMKRRRKRAKARRRGTESGMA
jgi:hypothetical protein